MNRITQKSELVLMLAQMVGPLKGLELTKDLNEQRLILARFIHDREEFRGKLYKFCNSDANHNYSNFYVRFVQEATQVLYHLTDEFEFNPKRILQVLAEQFPMMLQTIQALPVVPEGRIFAAETPFATYNFIRNLCISATQLICIFDRYLDASVFYRYLYTDVQPTVGVALVTLPQTEMKSIKDRSRYAEFLDLSRLFAAERGPTKYQLRTLPGSDFHDRWLRVDNQLFQIGGSLKDLDQQFTISRIESSAANIQTIEDALARAIEVFGPTNCKHP